MVEVGELVAPHGISVSLETLEHGRRLTLRADSAQTALATGRFASPAASVPVVSDTRGSRRRAAAGPCVHPVRTARRRRPWARLRLPAGAEPAFAARRGAAHRRSGDRHAVVLLAPGDAPARTGDRGRRRSARVGLARRPRRGAGRVLSDTLGVLRAARRGLGVRGGGASCAAVRRRGAARPPTRSRRTCRTGPTTAPPTGTAPRPAGRSATASPSVVESCATPACRSRAVELDSWFYRTRSRRPIAEIGYPHDVPPTGM